MQQILLGANLGIRVALTNHTSDGQATEPANADAYFRLLATGVAQSEGTNFGTTNYSGEWLLSGAAGDYDCRMTTVSGTLSGGTAGSWLNLATDREWRRSQLVGPASSTYAGTLEIRDATTLVVLVSATIDLIAEVL